MRQAHVSGALKDCPKEALLAVGTASCTGSRAFFSSAVRRASAPPSHPNGNSHLHHIEQSQEPLPQGLLPARAHLARRKALALPVTKPVLLAPSTGPTKKGQNPAKCLETQRGMLQPCGQVSPCSSSSSYHMCSWASSHAAPDFQDANPQTVLSQALLEPWRGQPLCPGGPWGRIT